MVHTSSLSSPRTFLENRGDAAQASTTTYSIAPGSVFSGTISTPGEGDWLAVDLERGQSYVFWVYGTNGRAMGLDDPSLTLHQDNTQRAFSDDIEDANPFALISYTATRSGTYFLDVGGSGTQTGTYTLHVSNAVFSMDEIATYLTDFYWGLPTPIRFDVTGGQLTYDTSALTGAGRQLADWAIEAWEQALGITFVSSTAAGANLVFDDNRSGAFAGPTAVNINTGLYSQSSINVSTGWLNTYGTSIDSYSYFTYLHEIGHALGLGHAGPYNLSARYGRDNVYLNDSTQASVMSYFDPVENTFIAGSDVTWLTPMAADLVAVHRLYGTPSAHEGNTTWGANSNVGGWLEQVFGAVFDGDTLPASIYAGGPVGFAIHDTGGFDTLDLRGQNVAQRIDLRPEGVSDIAGLTGNMVIARGSLIERAFGGAGNDTITGNLSDNFLFGEGGDNILFGGAGDDELRGLGGNDRVTGGTGRDRAYLGGGDDVFFDDPEGGRAGSDLIFFGAGHDTLFGGGGNDIAHGMEGRDSLLGGAGNDTLYAGAGHDHVEGGTGADQLWGGIGDDTLLGGAGHDVIYAREGHDRLFGDSGNDTLWGGAGNDTVTGGTGADRAYLGAGNDLFLDDPEGGNGGRDTVFLGLGDDTARGGGGDDVFFGLGGDDLLEGGAGNDTLYGGTNADTLIGGAGNDEIWGGLGRDRIEMGDGDDIYIDSAQGDALGRDTITGGAGADVFVFTARPSADVITDFEPGTDRLRLNSDLWTGELTAAELVSQFATVNAEGVIFQFGAGQSITLEGLNSLANLEADVFMF